MRLDLRKRIFLNFILVIALFGLLGAMVGVWLINRTTLNEAQRRVRLDLSSAWSVIQSELDRLQQFVRVLSTGQRTRAAYAAPTFAPGWLALEAARKQCGFDFLTLTDAEGRVLIRTLEPYRTGDYLSNDPFVAAALDGRERHGFAVLSDRRLMTEGGNLQEQAFTLFAPTPKAKPRAKVSEAAGMALVAAAPARDEHGHLMGVLYAGILLNRNHAIVKKISRIVFEDQLYGGKRLGTVTIFQWDTRIATNVILANGNRAIGTRVSAEVYDKVLENNSNWYDRAFVVNDWYLSAYDPIHDIEGRVVGILYVGVLAQKYDDIKWNLWKLYSGLSVAVAIVVLAVGLVFARRLTGSLRCLADAASGIARGDLNLTVPEPTANDEVRDLTRAFNTMTTQLQDREQRLKDANTELAQTNASLQQVNTNYIDMLGFVSHELQNTLGVIFTSARALDTGLVGQLNAAQATLVRNIARNIDSAVAMTRNYLDLTRLKKGDLAIRINPLDIAVEVVAPVLDELRAAMTERRMTLDNRLPDRLPIQGDPDLLRLVFRNLITNALRYGREGGRIRLACEQRTGELEFSVGNDGQGVAQVDLERIFQKFVRGPQTGGQGRSTGLGLFITREIIAKHGGRIRAQSEQGHWIDIIFSLPLARAEQ